MGPLFINQRRNSKSLCLEGEEGGTPTIPNTAIGTSTGTSTTTRNNERVDKDPRRSNNGPTTPTATGTINVSVTPCNNAINSKFIPHPKGSHNNSKSHVRSTNTNTAAAIPNAKINPSGGTISRDDSTSSTEDLSNNEEFPWMKKRNQMLKKNKITTGCANGTSSGGSHHSRAAATGNNAEMNSGQFLIMNNPSNNSNPNPQQYTQQYHQNPQIHQQIQRNQQNHLNRHSLLRKSQSNSQIANGNPHPHLSSSSNGIINGNPFSGNGSSGNIANSNRTNGINNNNDANNNNGSGLRKYLVLLQDCLAIKFVSAGQPHHSQHFHFAFNSNLISNDCSNKDDVNSTDEVIGTTGGIESSTTEVDHSLHGLYLYKGFREANLKCYWNATLCEAIQNLDYKGYIVPSTILVFALPRFLSVLRTAWSRKMLRYPPGYKVDFVGEIEEFITEPIPQGQFAPLSDSLCWAILELTSSSQEAFVDSIIFALSTAFPSMTLPSKELVYQTLEKLIKERKIYQTSHGYFVVTPDTFRYMNSGGDWSHFNTQSSATLPLDALMTSFYESDRVSLSGHSWESGGSANNNGEDFLIRSSSAMRPTHSHLKRHNSLKVIRQRDLDLLAPTMGSRSLSFRLAKPKSVFDSDRDDKYSSSRSKSSTMDSNTEGSSPGSKDLTSEDEHGRKTTSKDNAKPRKKSFFRRWFSFRRSSKTKVKNLDRSSVHLESLPRSPKTYSSISRVRQSLSSINNNAATQTATRSYENMNDLIENLDLSNEEELLYLPLPRHISKWNSLPSSGTRNRSRSRRSILDESPFYDTLTYKTDNNRTGTIPSGDNNTRVDNNGSKYSRRSIASSSLGYGSQGTYPNPHRSINTSTLDNSNIIIHPIHSVGSSGPGQRLRHLSANGSGTNKSARIDSPCPSTSVSAIYASIANCNTPTGYSTNNTPGFSGTGSQRNVNLDTVYRRRHPSQSSQSQNRSSNVYVSRPQSAYELLAYQNQNPNFQHNPKKSTESLMPQNSQHKSSKSSLNSKNKPYVSTTTITQKVRSVANTELEILLPLGALSKKTLPQDISVGIKNSENLLCTAEDGKVLIKQESGSMLNENKMKLDVESSPTKLIIKGKPISETQVTTTTVNNNGTVETHFSSSSCINDADNRLGDNCNCNKDSDVSH